MTATISWRRPTFWPSCGKATSWCKAAVALGRRHGYAGGDADVPPLAGQSGLYTYGSAHVFVADPRHLLRAAGFSKQLYERLSLRCTGMEFATEMIIKSSIHGARITEIRSPASGWAQEPSRICAPSGWLADVAVFLALQPALVVLASRPRVGFAGLGRLCSGHAGRVGGGVTFDAHTLLFASLWLLLGYQSVLFAVFAKVFAISEGLWPEDPRLTRLFTVINLERGLFGRGTLFCRGLRVFALRRLAMEGGRALAGWITATPCAG